MPCSPSAWTSTAVYDLVERTAAQLLANGAASASSSTASSSAADLVGEAEQRRANGAAVEALVREAELGLGLYEPLSMFWIQGRIAANCRVARP